MLRSFLLLMLAAAVLAPAATTEPPHRHLMMVVSKKLPGVTIYDSDTQEPICRATMGVSPHEAAFSHNGEWAYVPVYGTSSVGLPGTDEHVLHFIRTRDCKEMYSLDTGEYKRPHGIAVGNSGKIYLTSEVTKSILIIDPQQRKIIGTIPTDSAYSHMFAITPDEKKLYVSNVMSKTISVLDIPSRKLEKVIHTDVDNQRMTLSPDGKWFVTSLVAEHKIAFYRTSDNDLDFTVAVDGNPFVARFSRDGKYLYDAGTKDGQMHAWKIDVADRKVVATSEPIGTATGSLAVDPFNGHVYVSDANGNKISEFDPETWKVVKTLSTDKTPDAILFEAVS